MGQHKTFITLSPWQCIEYCKKSKSSDATHETLSCHKLMANLITQF